MGKIIYSNLANELYREDTISIVMGWLYDKKITLEALKRYLKHLDYTDKEIEEILIKYNLLES